MLQTTHSDIDYERGLLFLIAGTFILRLFIMVASPLNLHGDEAQYWAWSQSLDWGYFSKPPLIAWVIAASTTVFGHAEWAIRLPSAFLHCLTAWVIFTTSRRLFDARTGFWATCIYFFMPAVWLSSIIISTDVPLLFCWAIALNAWVALRETPSWQRAVQLGLALGFGLLSKYAMLFFLPVLLLAMIWDRPTRKALLGVRGLISLGLAAILFTPNILWNLSHDFATVGHTAQNANLSGSLFNPSELLSFLGDQFGVLGPISFSLLLWGVFSYLKKTKERPDFWFYLWFLASLPLFVISLQALLSRANANWAVTAYIAGPILIAIFTLNKPKALKALRFGLIGQSLVMMTIGILILMPALADNFGLSNSMKRMRGWPETVSELEIAYKNGHEGHAFEVIATDNRRIFYDLTYYDLGETAPLYMWRQSIIPGNHAEKTSPLPAMQGPVLLINYNPAYIPLFEKDFEKVYSLPPLEVELGGGKTRHLKLWAGYGYQPTQIHRKD